MKNGRGYFVHLQTKEETARFVYQTAAVNRGAIALSVSMVPQAGVQASVCLCSACLYLGCRSCPLVGNMTRDRVQVG